MFGASGLQAVCLQCQQPGFGVHPVKGGAGSPLLQRRGSVSPWEPAAGASSSPVQLERRRRRRRGGGCHLPWLPPEAVKGQH